MNKQKVGLSLIFFVLLVLLEAIYKIAHPAQYSVLGIFILNTLFGIGIALYHYEDKNGH